MVGKTLHVLGSEKRGVISLMTLYRVNWHEFAKEYEEI
jgi:hypothetical protein